MSESPQVPMNSERIPLLYLVRHGSTTLNGSNSFRGNRDVPLDAEGREDARRLAAFFKNIEFCEIVNSDRIRAEETADIIAQSKNMEHYATPVLRAWNVGAMSGKPKNEENESIVEHYVEHPDEVIPEGESLNQFKGRIRPAIMEAIKIADRRGSPLMLVFHSSCIHESSDLVHGNHEHTLVEPGGVAAIYATPRGLDMRALLRSRTGAPGKADTVS